MHHLYGLFVHLIELRVQLVLQRAYGGFEPELCGYGVAEVNKPCYGRERTIGLITRCRGSLAPTYLAVDVSMACTGLGRS